MKTILTAVGYLISLTITCWVLSTTYGERGLLIFAAITAGAILYAIGNAVGFKHGLSVGEARWRDGRERWHGQDGF
jgi:hypothetical protein